MLFENYFPLPQSTYFEIAFIFAEKYSFFAQKMLTSAKQIYFLKLHMFVYLLTNFQVSSLILTSSKITPTAKQIPNNSKTTKKFLFQSAIINKRGVQQTTNTCVSQKQTFKGDLENNFVLKNALALYCFDEIFLEVLATLLVVLTAVLQIRCEQQCPLLKFFAEVKNKFHGPFKLKECRD